MHIDSHAGADVAVVAALKKPFSDFSHLESMRGQLWTVYDEQSVISLPENRGGDRCDQDCTQELCGYWYASGWNDPDLTQIPRP